MKINLAQLKQHQKYELSEEVVFDKASYANGYVQDISNVNVKISYQIDDDFLNIHFFIKGDAILTCGYTLQPVPYKIKVSDDFAYTDNPENENETTILFDKNEIVLDDDILDIILSSLPMTITKPGATLPQDGQGYGFITEEEYNRQHEEAKTSPFDGLKDLDLDD